MRKTDQPARELAPGVPGKAASHAPSPAAQRDTNDTGCMRQRSSDAMTWTGQPSGGRAGQLRGCASRRMMRRKVPKTLRGRLAGLSGASAVAVLAAGLFASAPVQAAGVFATSAKTPADASRMQHTQSWSARSVAGHSVCPRGQTLIAPTGGWTDALGVSHVTYKADPGLAAVILPRGLKAGQITPALAADIGLRTSKTAGPAPWRRLVQQVLTMAQARRPPEFCRSPVKPGQAELARRGSGGASGSIRLRNGVYYESNWAGYAVTESAYGHGISSVLGAWTVPHSMTTSAPSAESTWLGIGGGIAGESKGVGLIQAGSIMQTNEGYRSFWEYIGSSGCTASTNFCGRYSAVDAISPGDAVIGEVWWSSTTSACFIFSDPNHSAGSWNVCSAVNIPYDHTSAEWVDETHIGQDHIQYYDSPGTVYWTDQGISTAINYGHGWNSPFAFATNAYVMSLTMQGPPSCNNSPVISYPADKTTVSGVGKSDIRTCLVQGTDYP